MDLPTGTRGKITAIGLLIFLIGVILLPLKPYWEKLNSLKEDKETITVQLRKFSRLAAQLPILEKRLSSTGSTDSMQQYLLQGSTPSLAAAELQRIMHRAINHHQGKITSAKILPGSIEKGFELVPVSIQLDIPLSGLQALLHEIEINKPRLFIDQLKIMTNHQPTRNTNRNRKTNNNLKITLALHGIRSQTKPNQN